MSKKLILKVGSKTIIWQLIKAKNFENKYALIEEKNYKYLVICFTRYDQGKFMKMLSMHYHELAGKIEEHVGKKMLVDDWYAR